MSLHSVDVDQFDEDGRPVSPDGERHRGQLRMAYRLARSHRDRLLFVRGIGWMVYDGKRWSEDERGAAKRAVLSVLRDALADSLHDPTLRADVTKCETDAGVLGVLGLASALEEFAATIDDLDADPHLLNCANGTLDLRTGQLREHDARDRLTKVTRAAYDETAAGSTWSTFLASVLPDESEREYLRRVIGQALYGRVREHLLPILIGTGANGKSTAMNALGYALGDYVAVIDPALLMAHDRGRGSANPELMELLGVRLVIGSETEEGRKLDEAVMKRLTGGDPITARPLYQKPVTWAPSHQLIYVTNHLPSVKGNDPATWRRVRVIPFDVTVPPEARDLRLGERLELAADEVLLWAVAGYLDYLDHGMAEPSSVMRATDAYKAESDDVARFITDACTVGAQVAATTRELYAAWQRWAVSDGAEPLTEKALGKELDRLGYEARRTKKGMTRDSIAPLETGGGEGW
ncbi:putative DNA primase/helicase [Yimella lutea]|uniref:Putative DNA primase/helicase n=1 Tax=Yimella lutea TaxID=587872 RepID=A0A542EJ13_9MICO|nr:phage/plasmid primase, P4 family [Yimella lutea]TQJ15332.1 putative DNA primase/helicase [Yimella lutea]